MLAKAPAKGKNVILITHKPNIVDALGKDWFDVREGEASIFKPEGGKYRLIARVQMDDWPKIAARRAVDGVAPMRGIVIAKMLVLALWGLYLAIGLTQGAGSDERRTSGEMLMLHPLASRCLSPDASIRTLQSWLKCGSRRQASG